MSEKKFNPIVCTLPLVILIITVTFFFMRLHKTDNIEINNMVNKPIPNFQLPDLSENKTILNNNNLPNKAYLLNVWGSWCIACSREHPLFVDMKENGLTIVGVNYKDSPDYALKYLKEHGNPYVMNISDEYGTLSVDLGLTGAPETFVVDNNGIIRQHITGEITKHILNTIIEPCLSSISKDTSESKIESACQ